jgi:hypothetical protein
MLCAGAQQNMDWSAAYRLFENERFNLDDLFTPSRRGVMAKLESQDPVIACMDDTLLRKRGRKVAGTSWKRDPLGPPFHTNFVWAQRFLQVSALLPESKSPCRARAIPVDFRHAPVPCKPRKTANEQDWKSYHEQQKIMKISTVGAQRIVHLRNSLNRDGHDARSLIMSVDGSFTNQTVFRSIPDKTAVIGRIRKDAKIFAAPTLASGVKRGRTKWYGDRLPTPEQLRQDESIPWQIVPAWAAGKTHDFEIKTFDAIRWIGSGNRDVRLVVIRPLAYRPRNGARLLYRQPVYLICSDPAMDLQRLLQSYIWRWEIELNFRDEKTVLGVGQAQVRHHSAVESVPALLVASYAFLLLASHSGSKNMGRLPLPRWRTKDPERRDSTPQLVNLLRTQLWGKALGLNKTHFVCPDQHNANPLKLLNPLQSAVCFASG